jgi:hypothetical protein
LWKTNLKGGLATPQVHALNENDEEVGKQHLNVIESAFNQDSLHHPIRCSCVYYYCFTFVEHYLSSAMAYNSNWMDKIWTFWQLMF